MPIAPGFEDYYDEVNKLRGSLGLATTGTATLPSYIPKMTTGGTGAATSTFSPGAVASDIGQYYTGVLSQQPSYAAIQRNIAGQLPPDVTRQLAQAAAERGVGIGSYGGGADQSALLRSLGLSSLDLTNRGIAQYGEAYANVPKLTPGELFVTPTAQAEMTLRQQMQERELGSAAELQAARLRSAEQMQANQLAQQAYEFGVNRADTWSGVQATNARLSGILGRLGTGETTGWGTEGVYGGAGTSDVGGTGYLTSPYGTYGTPYTGPSAQGYTWSGPELSLADEAFLMENPDFAPYIAEDYTY